MKLRLLPLAGVLYAILAIAQPATASSGALTYRAYSWTNTPTAETQCSEGTLTSLVLEWDSEPLPGCPADNFLVEITGSIYSPGPATQYALYSDDGARVYIDGQLVTWNWWDRGCSGFVNDWQLSEGWHEIRVEYYENGGGTCLWLYQVTSAGWSEIPTAYLSAEAAQPATTTTEQPTTTTEQPTTTTERTTTTTEQPTTTTIAPIPETTTTTSEATTTSSTLYQPTESTTAQTTTSTAETTSQTSPSVSSTIPEIPANNDNTSEPIRTPLTTSTTTTSSIPEKIAEGLTNDEAIDAATNPELVAQLTTEQAALVFAAIDEEEITPEEAAAIIEAVQDAPPSIRQQFEDKVNIFAGKYDGYIPLGSLVSVGTRRTIIITTGLLVAAPTLRKR
jgi:hypothetical protein